MSQPIPFSILDLAHIGENQTVADAIAKSQALAQCADSCGYHRLWLAEHHGMRGVASAATAVMLAAVGQSTRRIRLGAGGIMLPNHPPFTIAEQFGTLAALYPGRIDLGLGRAPGTDMATARALRRDLSQGADNYPAEIRELQQFLGEAPSENGVIAVPGMGSHVPLWLLGSSLYSAQLAGQMGLPYSFASHFAPDMLLDAISLYRANFRPSEQLARPYVSAGVMAVVADTRQQAAYHFTSVQQQFANLRRGANRPMPAPVDNLGDCLSAAEINMINHTLRYAVVGDVTEAEKRLAQFIAATEIDELILSFPVADAEAQLESIRLVANMDSVMRPMPD